MSQPQTRSILGKIVTNFINSLRPRQIRGTLIGTDYFGNKYYEIPPNPAIGKRRTSRWFDPPEKEDFQQELPAEWEAWLRGRRKEPPSEEEVLHNLAIIEMKKKNAAAIEAKYAKPDDVKLLPKDIKGPLSFPQYDDYEIQPGLPRNKR